MMWGLDRLRIKLKFWDVAIIKQILDYYGQEHSGQHKESFYRYVKNHKKLELDQEPNVEYLGHPINAYNLIKHSAIGWKFLNHSVVQPLNISLGHIGEYL